MGKFFTLRLSIYHVEPEIWRELVLPAELPFDQLHAVIQRCYGWQSSESYEFRHGKGKRLTSVIAASGQDGLVEGDDFREAKEVTLQQFVGRKQLPLRLLYRYDFIDDWIVEVAITGREEGDLTIDCRDGARQGPEEGSGGASSYMSCLRGDLQWMDDDFDPEAFNRLQLAKALRELIG